MKRYIIIDDQFRFHTIPMYQQQDPRPLRQLVLMPPVGVLFSTVYNATHQIISLNLLIQLSPRINRYEYIQTPVTSYYPSFLA